MSDESRIFTDAVSSTLQGLGMPADEAVNQAMNIGPRPPPGGHLTPEAKALIADPAYIDSTVGLGGLPIPLQMSIRGLQDKPEELDAFLTKEGYTTARNPITGELYFKDPKTGQTFDGSGTAWGAVMVEEGAPVLLGAGIPALGARAGAMAVAKLGAKGPGFLSTAARGLGSMLGMGTQGGAENVGAEGLQQLLRHGIGAETPGMTREELGTAGAIGSGFGMALQSLPVGKRLATWGLRGRAEKGLEQYQKAFKTVEERLLAKRMEVTRGAQTAQDNLAQRALRDLEEQKASAEQALKKAQAKYGSVYDDAVVDELSILQIGKDLGVDIPNRPNWLAGTVADLEKHGRELRSDLLDSMVAWDEELGKGAKQVFGRGNYAADLGPPTELVKLANTLDTGGDHTFAAYLNILEGVNAKYGEMNKAATMMGAPSFMELPEMQQRAVMDALRKKRVTVGNWTVGNALNFRHNFLQVAKQSDNPKTKANALQLVDAIDHHLVESGRGGETEAFKDLRNQMMFRRDMLDKGFEAELAKAVDPMSVMATLMSKAKKEPGPFLVFARKLKETAPERAGQLRYVILDKFFKAKDATEAANTLSGYHPEILKELFGSSNAGKAGTWLNVRANLAANSKLRDELLATPEGTRRADEVWKRTALGNGKQSLETIRNAQTILDGLPEPEKAVQEALATLKAKDAFHESAMEMLTLSDSRIGQKAHEAGKEAFTSATGYIDHWERGYIHAFAAATLGAAGLPPYNSMVGLGATILLGSVGKRAAVEALKDPKRADAWIRTLGQPIKDQSELSRRAFKFGALMLSQATTQEPTGKEPISDADALNMMRDMGLEIQVPERVQGPIGEIRQNKIPNITNRLERGEVKIGELEKILQEGSKDTVLATFEKMSLKDQLIFYGLPNFPARKDMAEAMAESITARLALLPENEQAAILKQYAAMGSPGGPVDGGGMEAGGPSGGN